MSHFLHLNHSTRSRHHPSKRIILLRRSPSHHHLTSRLQYQLSQHTNLSNLLTLPSRLDHRPQPTDHSHPSRPTAVLPSSRPISPSLPLPRSQSIGLRLHPNLHTSLHPQPNQHTNHSHRSNSTSPGLSHSQQTFLQAYKKTNIWPATEANQLQTQ